MSLFEKSYILLAEVKFSSMILRFFKKFQNIIGRNLPLASLYRINWSLHSNRHAVKLPSHQYLFLQCQLAWHTQSTEPYTNGLVAFVLFSVFARVQGSGILFGVQSLTIAKINIVMGRRLLPQQEAWIKQNMFVKDMKKLKKEEMKKI